MDRLESAFAVQVLRVGARITMAVALASIVYVLATPEGDNRGWLLAISIVIGLDGAAVALMPQRRLAERDLVVPFVTAWCAVHLAAVTVVSLLDGADSPYAGLFFVSVAYAAVSLPWRQVAALTAFAAAGLLLVALWNMPEGAHPGVALSVRVAALAATALVCATVATDRLRQVTGLDASRHEIVRLLAVVVEHRDRDTGGHVERIGAYSALIAREMGFGPVAAEGLRLAATLHDVGKVGIPDAVLLKPGPLTPAERVIMERHAEIGHEMLSGSGLEGLDLAASIALTHHEHFDGRGYPRGLSGEDIPLPGRVVAVADVFDALTSDRVYKSAMPFDEAVHVVADGAGTQFDPAVVSAFLRRLPEARQIHARREQGADPARSPAPTLVA